MSSTCRDCKGVGEFLVAPRDRHGVPSLDPQDLIPQICLTCNGSGRKVQLREGLTETEQGNGQ